MSIGVEFDLGPKSYTVHIGQGLLGSPEIWMPEGPAKVAVITQKEIPHGFDYDLDIQVFYVPDGERAKSLSVVERLCSQLVSFGLKRNDLVVGLGGGVVTDLAGFVASCYYRGVDYVNVSTTLLGMVDAALGGKTAVNLPEGKNLVGAFWQPRAVVCDTSTLKTLPRAEMISGYGEMAKYSFLGSGPLFGLPLEEQIAKCAEIKRNFVVKDEREGGARALLNYGHTLGHAIEALSLNRSADERLVHGQAVVIGLVFAAKLAEKLGRIDQSRVLEHIEVVEAYGLSYRLPQWLDTDATLKYMYRDKKSSGTLTFVLDGESGLEVVSRIDERVVREVLSEY